MATSAKRTGTKKDLSNRQVVRILMQEIVAVRTELKQDISALGAKFSTLQTDFGKLRSEFVTLRSDFGGLRSVVHQNQIAFMTNHAELEKRVVMLEGARA